MEEATNNAWSVETILCVAYLHEGWSNWHPFTKIIETITIMHMILGRFNVSYIQKATIEDYKGSM